MKRLRSPVHDVEELAGLLRSPEIGSYEVRTVLDKPDALVRRELSRFLRKARRTDTLLIHFACHGYVDGAGRLYLAATDTDLEDVAVTALPARLLAELIDESPSYRVILVLDCCFGGAIARVMTHRGSGLRVGEAFRGEGEGRVVLTASRAEEYAYEPGGELAGLSENPLHSVFAEALIEGLRTGDADVDGDDEVSAEDLYKYVHRRVVASGSAQTPSLWSFSQGTIFVAHRASGPVSALPKSTANLSTPWDATLLDWRYPRTQALAAFLAARKGPPLLNQAWRQIGNGDLRGASGAFAALLREPDPDGTAWWGHALCAASAGRWTAAAEDFERAAELLAGEPAAAAGALLLAMVCWSAAGRPRATELLDGAADFGAFVPDLAAYRALRTGDAAALARAVRLAPGLARTLAEAGVDARSAVAEAIRQEEDRLALLVRTGRWLESACPSGLAAPPETGGSGSRVELVPLKGRVREERARLGEGLARTQIRVEGLLRGDAGRGAAAEVGALREVQAAVVEALRRTDEPASITPIGIPPRRKMHIQ